MTCGKAFAIQCGCPTRESDALFCTHVYLKFRFSQQYNKARLYMSIECIMINHFLRIRIICFCKSRMRTSCQLFRRFWKTIGTSKM